MLGHHADPVAAYHHLIASSPTASQDQLLLTYTHLDCLVIITITMLSKALSVLLVAFGYGTGLYSLHSLRKGGTMAVYMQGLELLDIKRHGAAVQRFFLDLCDVHTCCHFSHHSWPSIISSGYLIYSPHVTNSPPPVPITCHISAVLTAHKLFGASLKTPPPPLV